jgi:hypothetical protein
MIIRVTPIPLAAQEVRSDRGGDVRCPACHSQTTKDPEDIGWVKCPILGDFICLGCCLDIAGICATAGFESHPFIADVERLAGHAGLSIDAARLVCLSHQLDMIRDQEPAGIKYPLPFDAIKRHLQARQQEATEASLPQPDRGTEGRLTPEA